MMNWKVFCRKRSWPNFKVLSRHSPGELRKTAKTSIRIAGCLSLDSKPGPTDYEAEVLTTRPRRLICMGVKPYST
jgi:hypothetical protein